MSDETGFEFFDAATSSTSLALPSHVHIPGTGTEPDWTPLISAKALVPSQTDAARWRDNPTYIYGFVLLRAGFCWEAHEVWEPVWLNCTPNSRERSLLRALIQTANARLKIAMGRERAAMRLRQEALRDLEEIILSDRLMGVDLQAMRSALQTIEPQPITSIGDG